MQKTMPETTTLTPRTILARLSLAAAAAAALPLWAAAAPERPARPSVSAAAQDAGPTVEGTTYPDEDLDLAFPTRGRVGEILVEPGQRVSAGEVLMRLDDRRERAQYEKEKMEAEIAGPVRVKLREEQLAIAENELARKQDSGSFTTAEKEEVRLKVQEARTQLALEEVGVEGETADMNIARATLEQMEIASPVDGVVREVPLGVGEAVTEQAVALKLIRMDPLEIRVLRLEPDQVVLLEPGQTMQVRYADGQGVGREWRDAKISWIDPMVEAGSNRHLIKLEMPNPDGVAPGRQVEVRLPDAVAAAANRRGF